MPLTSIADRPAHRPPDCCRASGHLGAFEVRCADQLAPFAGASGETVVLPLESILGFADVFGLMVAAIWLARRHERGNASGAKAPALRGHAP